MNKKQQIREIENIIKAECGQWLDKIYYAGCLGGAIDSAKALYNAGYRKISEDTLVLTKEELVKMMESGYVYETTSGNKINIIEMAREIERKETAKEFAEKLKNYIRQNEVQTTFFGNQCFIDEDTIDKLLKEYEVEE